ncbi:MAG: guanylate kinase [Chloroflexota bacterium]|nr:guanylate kinase [Chloroflexota bacterium]
MNNLSVSFDILKHFPLMIVISGPSGVGKDSVLRAMKKSELPIHHVVTVNTRAPRPDENEGVDYFFVSREKFEDMIANNELIEYSHVYDDYKGVPKSQIQDALDSGKDVVLRLDVQGAAKIKKIYPQAISIFLLPDSQEDWYKRLGGRRLGNEKDLDKRILTVKDELVQARDFDYLVVNEQNKLTQTVQKIEAIITAEHLRAKPRKIKL